MALQSTSLDIDLESSDPALLPQVDASDNDQGEKDSGNEDEVADGGALGSAVHPATDAHQDSQNQPQTQTQTQTQNQQQQHIKVDLATVEKLRFFNALKEAFPTQILLSNRSICRFLGVAPTSARRALKCMPKRLRPVSEKDRVSLRNSERDPRGRGNILTEEHIRRMVRFLEERGVDSDEGDGGDGNGRDGMVIPPWVELARLVGVEADISQRTVKRSMSLQGYRKCAKCYKMLLRPEVKALRQGLCRSMRAWGEADLRNVRWTACWHFGLNAERKAVASNEDVRDEYCEPCIYTSTVLARRDQVCEARWHCWGMVGWDYKSDLYFFETASGKLDEPTYYQILQRMVLEHVQDNPDILLEEDMDAAHGATHLGSPVRFLKEHHSIKSYFTAPHCPELTPMREIWNLVKGKVEVRDWHGEADVRDAIVREWDRMTAEEVNREIVAVIGRVKACFLD